MRWLFLLLDCIYNKAFCCRSYSLFTGKGEANPVHAFNSLFQGTLGAARADSIFYRYEKITHFTPLAHPADAGNAAARNHARPRL